MAEVKLLGTWYSPYSYRVICALKLKGIPYDYVEQDLFNKSSMLLHYNPVHKKIPVLVHGGKPISKSMIIIEYLDETWPDNHPLLPTDPYERALARFWVKFFDDKVSSMWTIYRTQGEEQEKAVKATMEILKTIEEETMGFLGDDKYFGGEKIGVVDMFLGGIAHWLEVMEKVGGIEVLILPHKFPKLHKWIQNLKREPVISENLPNEEEIVVHLKRRREIILASA